MKTLYFPPHPLCLVNQNLEIMMMMMIRITMTMSDDKNMRVDDKAEFFRYMEQ